MAQKLFDIVMTKSVGSIKTDDMWNIVNDFMMVEKKVVKEKMRDTLKMIKNGRKIVKRCEDEGYFDDDYTDDTEDIIVLVKLIGKNIGVDVDEFLSSAKAFLLERNRDELINERIRKSPYLLTFHRYINDDVWLWCVRDYTNTNPAYSKSENDTIIIRNLVKKNMD